MAVSDYLNARFLNEPVWRWFAFVVVMIAILTAWNGVLAYMR